MANNKQSTNKWSLKSTSSSVSLSLADVTVNKILAKEMFCQKTSLNTESNFQYFTNQPIQ